MRGHSSRFARCFALTTLLCGLFFAVGVARAQDDSSPAVTSPPSDKDKPAPEGTSKLKIVVTNPHGTPVANASVYVRYPKPHHSDLQELDLKTNEDGSVKVPPVPLGKVQVQVIAKGWHTFGEWYDLEKDQENVKIQLVEPPHWY
jgi:hypothetical protein